MIPEAFEYLVPKTLPKAISHLQQYGEKAKKSLDPVTMENRPAGNRFGD